MPGEIPPRKILLVGHCGPDVTYLRMAVKAALGEVKLVPAEDNSAMDQAIHEGVDLILFNRELGYGFDPEMGVDMIRALRQRDPDLRMMLISNHAEAQSAAIAAGAAPGFGKREIGSPRVQQLLRDVIASKNKS